MPIDYLLTILPRGFKFTGMVPPKSASKREFARSLYNSLIAFTSRNKREVEDCREVASRLNAYYHLA